MSTGTSHALEVTSTQRVWLKQMVAVLGGKPAPSGDLPLGGVFPEVQWDQKQDAIGELDNIVRELEKSQISKAPVFRKGIDHVRALGQQKEFAEALKTFGLLETRVNEEYAKFQMARGGGVQDLKAKGGAAKEAEKGAAKDAAQKPPASAGGDAAKYASEILKVGSKGPAVECLQQLIGGSDKSLQPDGKFGPATEKAVKSYQASKGLAADGIVGPNTWGALLGRPPAANGNAATAKGAAAAPTAAKPATGFIKGAVGKGGKNDPDDVKAVQQALSQRGGAKLTPDGKFTPETQKAIEEFQKKLGQFKPDGIIQPNRGTARALSGAAKIPPTPPAPKPIAPPVLGTPSLDKGAMVWHSTRNILTTNIEELKKGVLAAYGTEHRDLLSAIDASLKKLGKVVDKLDTRLAEALDSANKASQEEARNEALKKAQGILTEYMRYVDAEPLIGHMDSNPFGVTTSLQKVISDALSHLSQLLPQAVTAKV